jgi:hypothetical protein
MKDGAYIWFMRWLLGLEVYMDINTHDTYPILIAAMQ